MKHLKIALVKNQKLTMINKMYYVKPVNQDVKLVKEILSIVKNVMEKTEMIKIIYAIAVMIKK